MIHTRTEIKKSWMFPLALGGLMFLAPLLQGAVPTLINFQGKLLDSNKNPKNGTFSMVFRICDSQAASCASPLWSETQGSVSVTNGVFSTQLGSVNPLTNSVLSGATAYLEIDVAGETLSPRERLVASPYAQHASMADQLDLSLGGTNYIQVRDTLQTGAVFNVSSGTVGGNLIVSGVITAGSGSNAITTASGLLDATTLTGLITNSSLDPSSVTLQANSFNGANQLVQLDGSSQLPAASGALVTNLNASNLASGTVPLARMHSDVDLLNSTQTFTAQKTFSNEVTISTSLALAGTAPASGTDAGKNRLYPKNIVAAWIDFTGSVPLINDSYNVQSLTRNGAGDYTITLIHAMTNAFYPVMCTFVTDQGQGKQALMVPARTTTTFQVKSNFNKNYTDAQMMCVVYGTPQ